MLRFVNSEHLIQCHEVYEYKSNIWMVIDYMNWGSQEKIIAQGCKLRRYNENFCKYNILHVLLALNAMHQKNVLHRDVKSENVLANEDGEIKLADLGFSNFLSDKEKFRKTRGGTP